MHLHLIATLQGASLAVGQVHSPVVASGACEGDGSAQYVSIAIYDSETVGDKSEAVGVAGGSCVLLAVLFAIVCRFSCWFARARQLVAAVPGEIQATQAALVAENSPATSSRFERICSVARNGRWQPSVVM